MKTIIYSAAAWWRDSDPSIQVVGFSPEIVKEKILEAMAETEKDEIENSDEDTPFEDSMCWSGVHAFGIKEFLRSLPDFERRDVVDNLRMDKVSFVCAF